jgi:hypothetical protein
MKRLRHQHIYTDEKITASTELCFFSARTQTSYVSKIDKSIHTGNEMKGSET